MAKKTRMFVTLHTGFYLEAAGLVALAAARGASEAEVAAIVGAGDRVAEAGETLEIGVHLSVATATDLVDRGAAGVVEDADIAGAVAAVSPVMSPAAPVPDPETPAETGV